MSSKSQSLPRVKVSLSKFPNFFPERSKSRDLALQEGELQTLASKIEKTVDAKKKAHLKNLEFIERKSTIRNKVDAYLTDSRKIGILDHKVDDVRSRRSLTKISLQSLKPAKTASEQQKTYLMHLKEELNICRDQYQRAQEKIRNCQALTSQTKEQIIYYEQKIFSTQSERVELLQQRRHDLLLIQYQADKLKYMVQRLKENNSHTQKKIQDAHNRLKAFQKEITNLNYIDSVEQEDLDKQIYLLKKYDNFELQKSSGLYSKINETIHSFQENHITNTLEKYQQSIKILNSTDYHNEAILKNHVKITKELLIHRFCFKMLGSLWAQQIQRYQNYEKADKMIRMYSFDRSSSVQDSYRGTFQIKADLQKSISQKQQILRELQTKNKKLKAEWDQLNYDDNNQKAPNHIKIQRQFGQEHQLIKDIKDSQENQRRVQITRSDTESQRVNSLIVRLKEWVKKEEKVLKIEISKKLPIEKHFIAVILQVVQDVREQGPTFNIQKALFQAKNATKVNKFGNVIKKK